MQINLTLLQAKIKSDHKKHQLEQKRLKISSPTIDSTTDHQLVEDYESSQESGVGTSVGMHTFPYLRDHKWLTSPVKNLMDISVCGESKDDPGYYFVESTVSLFIFFQLYKLFFIFIAEIFF